MQTIRKLSILTCFFLLLAGTVRADTVFWDVNGHCYEAVLTGGGLTWTEARDLALQYGSHLVTIESAEENQFVYDLIKDIPDFWYVDGAGNTEGPYLGGFQPSGSPEPAGGWQWVSGEAWSFTNWKMGEPNNSGGIENSLVFFEWGDQTQTPPYGAKTWNDLDGLSTEVRGFIIEGDCTVGSRKMDFGSIKANYR